ncbi:MAG: DUF1501 domain-containing protein [Pirellulaceae bacterium]|nr:DUF1501 domain-containing protein [Pirellulaceae bacterium]
MACQTQQHWNRRTLLTAGMQAAAATSMSWLTPLATKLARAQELAPDSHAPAKSVILLWMQGGPSQRDTFDPKPQASELYSGGIKSIATSAKNVKIAETLPLMAEQMHHLSLVRSVVSREGDHARGVYNVKTGFRPDPTLVHPSIGAVMCHQLTDELEIPRHISMLTTNSPARGGYLGDSFDAFQVGDPQQPVPDVLSRVNKERDKNRRSDLFGVVEREFARGRLRNLDERKTLHQLSMQRAVDMMASTQLEAFSLKEVSQTKKDRFGDTSFGRACLAATQLIQVGVRCVEITLGGWDSHINNTSAQASRTNIMDAAMSSLLAELEDTGLLESTIVVWGGEFGRTPWLNSTNGRDHWPHGFTIGLGGGGIQGGRVIGETNPEPDRDAKDETADVVDAHEVQDIHATVFKALGIDYQQEIMTPVGRPMIVAQGTAIKELF